MSEDISALREAISQYETQLSQVQLAVAASPAGPDRDNLVALQSDIQELITLTKENLSSLQSKQGDHLDREYALLKAELEECESTSNSIQEPAPDASTVDIQEDLDALQGMKCQAPHSHQYGDVSYHNALVCAVERNSDIRNMNQIQVRVMFTNPTHRNMLPCPYYLEGECRFSDDQCHYSHGELVLLSSLKEYKEPDFGAVCPGAHVLVKRDDKLWHRAVVLTSSGKTKWQVKLESSGRTEDVDLQCILPLDSGSGEADDSEDSSDDDEDDDSDVDDVEPSIVERSLLMTPASMALGEWEKHTRGIGSRLMARMGYVTGTGLGKDGEGRVEPVEAMVFPAGKSLDHCMELREKAGGDDNLFRVDKRLRRLQRKQAQQSARQKQTDTTNVFDFINTKLGGGSTGRHPPQPCGGTLKTETNKGLNVEGFRVGEEIRRVERDLGRLQESLSRHSHGSSTHSAIASKLANKQAELDGLRASERNIDMERALRKDQKKLTVF